MRDLQRRVERFFYRNRNKGLRNLMLYIAIANVLVYLVDAVDPSHMLYIALCFDRTAILYGQVWRLFSYIFLPVYGNPIALVLMMFLYYRIGAIVEGRCGVLKFNLYYLTGVLIIDALALLLNWYPSIESFHYSLLLVYATLCPEDQLLLFFIIPIRMKYLALVYAFLVVLGFVRGDYLTMASILNYLIFFGANIPDLIPALRGYRSSTPRPRQRRPAPDPHWADRYRSRDGKRPYRHKCTVCGRTDTEYPGLEFRYCSRCNGYYCYCSEHINDHVHIQ